MGTYYSGARHSFKTQKHCVVFVGYQLLFESGYEHHDLCHDALGKPSQLSFQKSDKGVRCLVYTEDMVTKTNEGGLGHIRKECKVVWVYALSGKIS